MNTNIIEIAENDLKEVTLFLIEKKILFHPKISPIGIPDFSDYYDKEFIIILDRNLFSDLIQLLKKGSLKDINVLNIISSLMAWIEINNLKIAPAYALIEYAHHKKDKINPNIENDIFQKVFKNYKPNMWFDLALNRINNIQKIELFHNNDNDFFKEDDHFLMHYLEMLKMAQLYFNKKLSIVEKFKQFYSWIYDNILICQYTTTYSTLVFGEKSRVFKRLKSKDFENINKNCLNQAWDLTYLSSWSTQYYFENESNEILLFATRDKELKEIFTQTHDPTLSFFEKNLGQKNGKKIREIINSTYLERSKPTIETEHLQQLKKDEISKLKKILINYGL